MKFGRIAREGLNGKVARLVVVEPENCRVVDLARAASLHYQSRLHATADAANRLALAAFPGSMAEALRLGDYLKDNAHDIVVSRGDDASLPIDSVEWLAASDPPIIRDALNFLGHLRDFAKKLNYTPPTAMERVVPYSTMSPSMVLGHDQTVPWPGFVKTMDYELELGWVIGRECKDLTPETARNALFGITLFNDFSARDRQPDEVAIGMGATKCKNFAHAVGPWITTLDEFEDLYNIDMEVRLNGETKCRTKSNETLWKIEEVLAYMSLGEYLRPGDLIGSGTAERGSAWELGVEIKPGDVVELEASGIGVLRSTFGKPSELPWWPSPQTGLIESLKK